MASHLKNKIHIIKIGNKSFVFDINSATSIELDDFALKLFNSYANKIRKKKSIEKALNGCKDEEIKNTLRAINSLVDNKILFADDSYTNYKRAVKFSPRSMVLHVAHTCNLNCKYCYADAGSYGSKYKLMSKKTAQDAVDFLIDRSKHWKNLYINFYGGEPLLMFDLIKHLVAYAKKRAKAAGKSLSFGMSTNATLFNKEVLNFVDKNKFSLVLSFDGPKDINDRMRPFADGRGTYDTIVKNIRKIDKLKKCKYAVRATFTRENPHIYRITKHLVELGFKAISVEPCQLKRDSNLYIRKQDLKKVFLEYDKVAEYFISSLLKGKYFDFHPFSLFIRRLRNAQKHIIPCGAGHGVISIDPVGNIYPCHRLPGNRKYKIGDIYKGINNKRTTSKFCSIWVGSKNSCKNCWAKYLCGGGCQEIGIYYYDNISKSDPIACAMIKHRIKLSMMICAVLAEKNEKLLDKYFLEGNCA